MNIVAFFSSIVKLIEVFCQLNKAADIEETFSVLKQPVASPYDLSCQNLFWPTGLNVETFDFIVVGAGTSGSVAAKRLAEHGNGAYKVLLLELGSDPPPQTFVPAFLNRYFGHPDVSLTFTSVSHKDKGGVGGLKFQQGKVLGGTGIKNAMVFNRGHPEDYNLWANVTKDPSWEYENILQYFKKLETYEGDYPDAGRGSSGPIGVTHRVDSTMGKATETWLNAGREIGVPSGGANAPQKISFTPYELNMKHGRRHTSFTAYIGHKKAIPNLKIITYSNVTKVLFDEHKRAIGVEYHKHGITFVAKATKEVILTAGVFGTSKILLNSGVGPADHLKELKIPVISDVPVGNNLIDHPIMTIQFTLNDPKKDFGPSEIDYDAALQEFLKNGTGPLTSWQGQIGQSFLASTLAVKAGESHWGDYQLLAYLSRYPLALDNRNAPHEKDVVQVWGVVSLARPKSVGTVRLNASQPQGQPIADHAFYSDPEDYDKKVTIEAIRKLVSVFEETKTYQAYGAKFKNQNFPACKGLEFNSDEFWWCYIKEILRTGNHHCGTTRMGRIGDPAAVVDPQLKVIGVKGLRVLDASVMPHITNGNIQAAVLVIAEKGVAQVLHDHPAPAA